MKTGTPAMEQGMIREEKFVLSHRPYAVDLSSLDTDREPPTVRAAWFRRRKGVLVAAVGVLWDVQRPVPADAAEFLARHDDGRYGGDCLGRWDGSRYWGAQEPEAAAAHLDLLRPMLASYPGIPPGFDGWYVFEK
jgi:hypothetical protein